MPKGCGYIYLYLAHDNNYFRRIFIRQYTYLCKKCDFTKNRFALWVQKVKKRKTVNVSANHVFFSVSIILFVNPE